MCAGVAPVVAEMPELGPLATYVAKPDPAYKWTKQRTGKVDSCEYAELLLTSQKWRDIEWKHQLFVLKPASVVAENRQAILFIAGGGWKPELEQLDREVKLPREARIFAAIAEQTKSPVAVLQHVPHQPIFGGKVEDQIIAYTFDEFLKSRDPEWPLLVPMVKSAVRGMDATQEFARQQWSLQIDSFTISGASKRGWTTWLTGAVDKRAVAIAPMVIDVLNMAEQMRLQKATFGKPSEEIADYSERGLTERLESPEAQALRAIVDPFQYRERLVQPKLVILGTNDRYWPLDALNLYWDGLKGEKHILYIPNNGHGLNDVGRLSGSLLALHQHTATGQPLPKLDWKFEPAAGKLRLRVQSSVPPQKVDTWTATAKTRDFRDSKWSSSPAQKDGNSYVCEIDEPQSGYAAMFGELVFDGQALPYFLSTNVRIVGGEETKVGGGQ